MTTLLSMLDRFEQAAVTYETSTAKADRDELHAARRAIMEAFEARSASAEPHPEDKWTHEQHVAAVDFLTGASTPAERCRDCDGYNCDNGCAYPDASASAEPEAFEGRSDRARSCTCHPDDNPPVPCAEKYAFSECIATPASEREAELVKALEFYANPEVYKPHPHGIAFDRRDLSFVARAAIPSLEQE